MSQQENSPNQERELPSNYTPHPQQLELFRAWEASDGISGRTIDVYDASPRFHLTEKRYTPSGQEDDLIRECKRSRGGVTSRFTVRITPYGFRNSAGKRVYAHPGPREEVVERALRFMAIQRQAEHVLLMDPQTQRPAASLVFTVHQLRKLLQSFNHHYSVSQLKEALSVMHHCHISYAGETADLVGIESSPILPYLKWISRKDDTQGRNSLVEIAFHPTVANAVLNLDYYPTNAARVLRMKIPLARYLTDRLTHNYRQASKSHPLGDNAKGYALLQSTIEAESGMKLEKRNRDNHATVRIALREMAEAGVLYTMRPFDEEPKYSDPIPGKAGRPRVTDILWTLYPSRDVVSEIISGNATMLQNKKIVKPDQEELRARNPSSR